MIEQHTGPIPIAEALVNEGEAKNERHALRLLRLQRVGFCHEGQWTHTATEQDTVVPGDTLSVGTRVGFVGFTDSDGVLRHKNDEALRRKVPAEPAVQV